MMNMQMNMNPNMVGGLNPNQMSYYNNQPQPTQKLVPNVDNILFVADLPDEACEEDLSNFFKAYNFSFAKVFHNVLRTHAFVTFNTSEDAARARLELNGVKISAKYANNKLAKAVRLCKYETKQSQVEYDKRTNLLVKNISKDVSSHSFFNMFRHFGDVRSCKLMVDLLGISKGFGYVSYYRLEDSERAIVELDNKEVHGKNLKVTHLEHGRAVEKRRNNIYVKHIPKSNFNDEALMKLFQPYGEIKSAVVLLDGEGNSKGFGFVCFARAEDAEEAYKNMNEKSMFKDLPALYVNFAMKKSERLEHLQKKKEENYKSAQKMTIFAKIKDENSIKSEIDFVDQIKNYLKISFGKDYEPKTIKIRFETKNAFVTMNSQRDAEEFIRKFQEHTKENQTTLFFNLYKSKVERISANSYFKKYNQFSGEGEGMNMGRQQRGGFKKYNDFATQGQGQQGGFNMNGPKRYNNFDENNMNVNPNMNMNMNQQFANQQQGQGQQRGYVSYNNFPNMQQGQNMNQNMNMNMQMQQNKVQQPMMQQSKFDPQDEDAIGEYLYNFVEGLYPEHASKITGMLMETEPTTRFKLINSRPEELTKIIQSAHNQLLSTNN